MTYIYLSHDLQIWPPGEATCISSKFDHQVAPIAKATNLFTCIDSKFGHQLVPLASVANMITRWHHLQKMKIWPPGGATCINSKFYHKVKQKIEIWPPVGFTCNIYMFGKPVAPLVLPGIFNLIKVTFPPVLWNDNFQHMIYE